MGVAGSVAQRDLLSLLAGDREPGSGKEVGSTPTSTRAGRGQPQILRAAGLGAHTHTQGERAENLRKPYISRATQAPVDE